MACLSDLSRDFVLGNFPRFAIPDVDCASRRVVLGPRPNMIEPSQSEYFPSTEEPGWLAPMLALFSSHRRLCYPARPVLASYPCLCIAGTL